MPEDVTLDFFTYGIFKPGEIAYSKIKDYVVKEEKKNIEYLMKYRDGVPLLINKEILSEFKDYPEGYIFHFNNPDNAYKIICETISDKLYEWSTVEIDNKTINVLIGKDIEKGIVASEENKITYKGKEDPMFSIAMNLIYENIVDNYFSWEDGFYKLQMNYMLLWSAIDRYCKLKYNQKNEYCNHKKLSKEPIFEKALKKYAKEKGKRIIYSTDDLESREFKIKNPLYCMNYYYTLRCNVVHRGKTSNKDVNLLEQAAKELFNIFTYILEDTFDYEEPFSKFNDEKY